MLPSHGAAYSVFMLADAARRAPRPDVEDWVRAARSRGSYLAAATDFHTPAAALIKLDLVTAAGPIALAQPLLALGDTADRPTLESVARLLLAVAPPPWLPLAVTAGGLRREYIPSDDLAALSWLEPHLDQLLLDSHAALGHQREDHLRKQIGDAAELYLMAAFKCAERRPVHVAQLSDAYGYDIEIRNPTPERVEVKAAGPNTRGSFHLTKNEFDKSKLYGQQWRLLQVVFISSAFTAQALDASHVLTVQELTPGTLESLVPPDTLHFQWRQSATLTPPAGAWRSCQIPPDPRFAMPGFR